jgi:hypothetical protein
MVSSETSKDTESQVDFEGRALHLWTALYKPW